MTDNNDIPIPDDSGSSGEQEPASSRTEIVPASPQKGLPVVDALAGLAASRTKSLGEFGSIMLSATARQLADENLDLKREIRQLREERDAQRDQLEVERVGNARLGERISSNNRNRHVRNFAIAVGTLLTGLGVNVMRTSGEGYSWGLVILGSLMLLVSWFSPTKGNKS